MIFREVPMVLLETHREGVGVGVLVEAAEEEEKKKPKTQATTSTSPVFITRLILEN